jgi:hypothetical protein
VSVWSVASVATVATQGRVGLSLKGRLVESALRFEARAAATKPKDEQEIFEPVSLGPLRELIDLLLLHWICAALPAESGFAGTVAGLEFLQIGNLSGAVPQRLTDNRPTQFGTGEDLS